MKTAEEWRQELRGFCKCPDPGYSPVMGWQCADCTTRVIAAAQKEIISDVLAILAEENGAWREANTKNADYHEGGLDAVRDIQARVKTMQDGVKEGG